MQSDSQRGFTLIELVIFVLILGFLLAVTLKGQELLTGAKVKRLGGQIDEVRAAYFGFQDRFRALPGDFASANVTLKCGPSPCLNGNGDARIRANAFSLNGSETHEDLLVWSHLSAAGFLAGEFRMSAGQSQASDLSSPKNAYQVFSQLVFDGGYGISNGGVPRHNLKTGGQIPVAVLMELDRKVDDGKPYRGALQFSSYQGNAMSSPIEGTTSACTTALNVDADWNMESGNANCGAAALL